MASLVHNDAVIEDNRISLERRQSVRRFDVTIPLTFTVFARDEEQAKEQAWKCLGNDYIVANVFESPTVDFEVEPEDRPCCGRWDKREHKTLETMVNAGCDDVLIACQLGRTPKAVKHKRLAFQGQRNQEVTA